MRKFIATFQESEYRGVYGGKGDDGWDRRYTWELIEADSDATAATKARAMEKRNCSLRRVFAISHEVQLT